MTQDEWVNRNATAMALTFGVSPAKARLFLNGLARSSNVFRFSKKSYPTDAQLEWMADIVEKAGEIFKNQDEMRKLQSAESDQALVIIPLKRIDDLAAAFSGQKEKEFVENQTKQSKLLVT
jgi:hypothetical protein